MSAPDIIYIGPNDKPLLIDPTTVGCGFLLLAYQDLAFFKEEMESRARRGTCGKQDRIVERRETPQPPYRSSSHNYCRF